MTDILTQHSLACIAAYWLFSAVVGGMPDPIVGTSIAYRWAFGSLHIMAGNLGRAVQARYGPVSGIQVPPGSALAHQESTVIVPEH